MKVKGYIHKGVNLNTLKSYIGKTVNLYLRDGSVIACVTVLRVSNNFLWVRASSHGKPLTYCLRDLKRVEGVQIFENTTL